MAVTFGANSTDKVNHGSGSSIDFLNPFTVLVWLKPTTITAGRGFVYKENTAFTTGWDMTIQASGNIRFDHRFDGGVNMRYQGNTLGLTVNVQSCVMVTFDSAASPQSHIYIGTMGTGALAEVGYGTSTAGTGNPLDDSAADFVTGNRPNDAGVFQGDLSTVMFLNRVLTLGEGNALMPGPYVVSGTKLFTHYGWYIGTQPDWSGNGNSGTPVVVVSLSTHGPMRPAFGRMRSGRYAVTAAGRTTKNTRAFPLGMEIGMNWRGAA